MVLLDLIAKNGDEKDVKKIKKRKKEVQHEDFPDPSTTLA